MNFNFFSSSAAPDGDVFYRGPVRGVSSMKTEADIGPAINHTYTVSEKQTLMRTLLSNIRCSFVS